MIYSCAMRVRRVRRVRRAEMPSALRRSKRAGGYIYTYVTVVATLKSAKF